jgi:hypothetical protein
VLQVGNRDYKFCVGTHRSSHKGRFSGRGCLTAFCRERIAISKNLIWLRATGIRSLARALHKGGGRPVRCVAIGAASHGTRPGQRQRHDAVRRRLRPLSSRVGISRLVAAQSMPSRPRPSAPWGRRPKRAEKHAKEPDFSRISSVSLWFEQRYREAGDFAACNYCGQPGLAEMSAFLLANCTQQLVGLTPGITLRAARQFL